MGLLDDAIREHLDLKRRRGADPAEVEQAEREALGPVRRNRDPGDTAESEDQVSDSGFAYDQDDDQEWDEPAPFADDRSDPYGDYDEDEPEFDAPADRVKPGPVRPRSLRDPLDDESPGREPVDHEPTAPHHGEDSGFDEALDPEASARRGDWSAAGDDAVAAEPFPTAPGASRRPADTTGEETTEYRIPDVTDDPEDGEDVLEETPEFLQDTPDHDRLWFEQRPPRDFDFDG